MSDDIDEKLSARSRGTSARDYMSDADDGLIGSQMDDQYVDQSQLTWLFSLYFIATIIMMIWPWIFFGVLWRLGGVQMPRIAANVAHNHPQDVTFFVTQICSLLSMIIVALFSRAVVILARKWISHRDTTTSHISFFTSLKTQHAPPASFFQGKSHLFLMILFYNTIFTFVTPGLDALLSPAVFVRTNTLTGTELDFGSTDDTCLSWFNSNTIPHFCDWNVTAIPGLNYTTCLEENQLVDVLESGRGSILTYLSNNDVSLTYTQLGGTTGLRFFGSMRGVLALGPNGIPALDTLSSTSFATESTTPDLFYNYTLDLQGVSNNVSCFYDTSSPVYYTATVNGTTSALWQINGTCPPGRDVLLNATYLVPPSSNSLGFWACKASDVGDSFYVYIRGSKFYAQGIGNITCNVSPYQLAVFPLQYMGQPSIFNFLDQAPISTSPRTYTELLTRSIMALGSNFVEGQTMSANAIAESVITYGVKSLGLQPYVQDPQYLRLYEAMIQGILDYEATYIRLIYSAKRSAPSSCLRAVNGTADVEVFGWFASRNTAAYLVPVTLINLTTLILLAIAANIADVDGSKRLPNLDPTNPTVIIKSTEDPEPIAEDDVPLALGYNQDRKFGIWPKRQVLASSESVSPA